MGGHTENPTYEEVCKKTTNHAETVEVTFDPQQISYQKLLEEFFTMHDPTSLNQQGGDIGTQYRSAIFYTTPEQEALAFNAAKVYGKVLAKEGLGAIVTEINDAKPHKYWLAEEYHQRYLEKNPNGYDCHSSTGVAYPSVNEDELKKRLDPLSYEVLRKGATERPFTGEYTDSDKVGVYKCKACNSELFRSETKFHSGCGWPSFYAPTEADAVILLEDRSLAPRVRTEVRCANCNSHLGHVFEGEGFDTPTDQRWCINSVSLILEDI
jgi:methionine-S-sulfoxide reductase/methionine-R-sulfoxide reductase